MNADSNSTDNRDESGASSSENESWTFLGDESTSSIHRGSGVDNILEHHDDDTKLSSKTSRSSSSGLS